MSRITGTILTSSLGMRQHLPCLFLPETFANKVSDFLKAPIPQTLDEAYEEASLFAWLITEREWVSARGINHFASERWNLRWLECGIDDRRTPLPGGWTAAVDELVDANSTRRESYCPRPDRSEPRQLLLPFWGGESERRAGAAGDFARSSEDNRFILNTMLKMPRGEDFDPVDCDEFCYDMRQSPADTDLLLFGIVASH